MTDEYIARERALSLAHTDATRDRISWDAILKTADGYLEFLMPDRTQGDGTINNEAIQDELRKVRLTPAPVRLTPAQVDHLKNLAVINTQYVRLPADFTVRTGAPTSNAESAS